MLPRRQAPPGAGHSTWSCPCCAHFMPRQPHVVGPRLLTQVPGTGSHTMGSARDPAALASTSPGSRWVGGRDTAGLPTLHPRLAIVTPGGATRPPAAPASTLAKLSHLDAASFRIQELGGPFPPGLSHKRPARATSQSALRGSLLTLPSAWPRPPLPTAPSRGKAVTHAASRTPQRLRPGAQQPPSSGG